MGYSRNSENQFENFYNAILKKENPLIRLEESMGTLRTIEALIQSAKTQTAQTVAKSQ